MIESPSRHYVLVPGFWLGGWAWDRVAATLRLYGHRVDALTLPGLESLDADRSAVTFEDHVRAVAAVLTGRDTILVAHSGAGALVSVVLDRDPASVGRVVYVDSGPAADGWNQEPGIEPADVDFPLPPWDKLRENGVSVDGLTISDLENFSRRAVPHPAAVAGAVIRLSNPQRRSVPTTIIACSFRSDVVRELASEGMPMFTEVATVRDLTFLDLPTGHWPMFSRPDDLAEALARLA